MKEINIQLRHYIMKKNIKGLSIYGRRLEKLKRIYPQLSCTYIWYTTETRIFSRLG